MVKRHNCGCRINLGKEEPRLRFPPFYMCARHAIDWQILIDKDWAELASRIETEGYKERIDP